MSLKTINEALNLALIRAIKVRKKASFGNSNSGYEFGGWKSLLEDSVRSSQAAANHPSIIFPQPDLNRNTKNRVKSTVATTLCPSSQSDNGGILI